MARTTETISVTLRPETLRALDAAAQSQRRSRSQFVDLTLERALSLTGEDRQRDLQAIATEGLADASADATLDAFEKMAKAATRK
jgi:predicted transcriptional regulator